jgi:hypothetical protein
MSSASLSTNEWDPRPSQRPSPNTAIVLHRSQMMHLSCMSHVVVVENILFRVLNVC